MDPDPNKEIEINVKLLERAVTAIENLSRNLKFVVLPTGTKAYGVHLLDKFPFAKQLPLSESLPRIPEPYASEMFYYSQTDFLARLSKGKTWTWCEVIPDVVIGFVPNNNIYCLAQHLGLYLSLYRQINSEGAKVTFPGNTKSWKILCNDSSQDLLARFSIHASLNPSTCGQGQRFNVSDNSKPSTWSAKWSIICQYFGLKGVGPPESGSGPQPGDYVAQHVDEWKVMEKEKGLVAGRVGNDRSYGGFPFFIMSMFDFDRHLDMTKCHKAWGDQKEEIDTKTAWWTAFDRFREANIIP
jgi:hypothetical protein